MARRKKQELGDWQDESPVVDAPEMTDEEKVESVLPELPPVVAVADGTITPSGVRIVVPHVATGPAPHTHWWQRGRRADNSQIYYCACGLERNR